MSARRNRRSGILAAGLLFASLCGAPIFAADTTPDDLAGRQGATPCDGSGSRVVEQAGVQWIHLCTYTRDRLNRILTGERETYGPWEKKFPGNSSYDVDLYRVIYPSVIPETGKATMASGLLALPHGGQRVLPFVSYQHGTTFGRKEVPSFPENSYETRLILARFASHGYGVIAADYFGQGISTEPNSFVVKASTQQACLDLLKAVRLILPPLGRSMDQLFLSGWSQGGWATMAFLNRLEEEGIKVTAVATASAFNDLFATINNWIHALGPNAAVWLPAIISNQIFANSRYYNIPDLPGQAIRPQYLAAARRFADFEIDYGELSKIIPTKVSDFLTPEFIAMSSLGKGSYWERVQANQVYRWRSVTPLRSYYGAMDEATPPYVAQLPVGWQKVMNGATTSAVPTGAHADHRKTFFGMVFESKPWFDSLLRR